MRNYWKGWMCGVTTMSAGHLLNSGHEAWAIAGFALALLHMILFALLD